MGFVMMWGLSIQSRYVTGTPSCWWWSHVSLFLWRCIYSVNWVTPWSPAHGLLTRLRCTSCCSLLKGQPQAPCWGGVRAENKRPLKCNHLWLESNGLSLANLLILQWSILARYRPTILRFPDKLKRSPALTEEKILLLFIVCCCHVTAARTYQSHACVTGQRVRGGGADCESVGASGNTLLWGCGSFACLLSRHLVTVRATCMTPSSLIMQRHARISWQDDMVTTRVRHIFPAWRLRMCRRESSQAGKMQKVPSLLLNFLLSVFLITPTWTQTCW